MATDQPETRDKAEHDPLSELSLSHRMLLEDPMVPVNELMLPEVAIPVTIVGEIPDKLKPFFGQ